MFDVVILAGGLGTRLRSVVSDLPKCMAPVAGRPFLAWILQWLEKYDNAGSIVLSLGYKSHAVTDWIESDSRFSSLSIDWVIEETPLGTGGGIRLAMSKVKADRAIVLNGDTFFDVDLNSFIAFGKRKDTPLAVALKPMTAFDRYGSVTLADDGRIVSFNEKGWCDRGMINGGVYCIDPRAGLFEGRPHRFSFEKEILEPMSREKSLYGFVSDGPFIDIGIPEDYALAQTFLPANI